MLMQPKKLRVIAEFLVVSICTLLFALTSAGICASVLENDAAGTRDFVEYWASGHQLAHHANPYDGGAILGLERSAGFPSGIPVLIMWNPPPALLLVLPLGFLSPTTANLLWSLLLLTCLVVSVRMVWIMHGRPKNQVHWLGYSFAPTLACLLAGQVSIFVLLGLVLFLHLHRSRSFLAGVSLWLCLLKPHLFLPFGVVLIVWAIITRSYKLLAGTAIALGVSTAIAFILDPLVWAQYGQMMSTTSTARMQIIPCMSIMFRWIISPKNVWLQYLPSAFGCIWALAYFRKHYDHWDWIEHGSLLMLVSVLVAPYTWLMDQAIVIPALLHAAYLTRSRSLVAILALASAVIEAGILWGLPLLHSAFYLWTAPAWLVWYLYATKRGYTTNAYEVPLLPGGALMGR
jgi:Glycosyltransferase family 87